MERQEKPDRRKDFFSNPQVIENYALLQGAGVFSYIETLEKDIGNYKNLFSGALDIINRVSISEIMEATVWQISDHFLPSFITFLWKPVLNRDDITVTSYKNYKLADLGLAIDSIGAFEPFFREHREPLGFGRFASEMKKNNISQPFDSIEPELITPILGPSGLYGLVLMGHKILEDAYTEGELFFIQNLMTFVSKAILNHLHYEQTLRDIKTGLYNNGFLLTRLNEEIARARRSDTTASIIIMDVDKFKIFNDNYGHIAGDKVLEHLAITIKQGVRADDVPARFGGEEFTVLLPDTGAEQAWIAAERLRTMVEAMRVGWDTPLPQVTISLGIFTFGKNTNLSAVEIIRRADEALYLSKERGRNRSTAWKTGLFKKIVMKSAPAGPVPKTGGLKQP